MGDFSIRKVCVIGAGTMGGGIAAHLTNLGFEVSLLDTTQHSALSGLDRTRQGRPPAFYVPERASEIHLGNIEEHLHLAAEADWVCEAIVERVEEKQALFAKLDPIIRPDAMITTNTSGIQIELLSQGLSDSFRRRFMGVHFFNPPRYLKLLELIPTPETDPSLVTAMTGFLECEAARRVILAKDSPGFIANRYGMWCTFHAIRTAERLHLSVVDVDVITGALLGRPKSGTFRLADIVGLDVMRDIAQNLRDRCPEDSQIHTLELTQSMVLLLARGWLGDKTGHGYYRKEGKEILALDLNTLGYRMSTELVLPNVEHLKALPLPERLRHAIDLRGEVGEYLREYLLPALRYADAIKQEVSHSVLDFDRVMMWGFGWEMGPFAMIDALGPERVGLASQEPFFKDHSMRTFSSGYAKIKEEPDFRTLQDFPEIGRGENYILRDLGDGVTAVGFTNKMGVIGPKLVDELTDLLHHKLDRFVLTSEGRSFSAGFDLRFFADRIAAGSLESIDKALFDLQKLGELLETKPCVAAIFGHCLGAGLEVALSCSKIVAAAETQIGLPESRVGLIPGGRGVTLMRLNNLHTAKRLAEITVTIAEGTIATNVDFARQMGYLRPGDVTVYNPDRLISEAKRQALSATAARRPEWTATAGPLVGMIDGGIAKLRASGAFTEHDELIAGKIRQIMARSTSYEDALERERAEFLNLCGRNMTQARIRHMVETHKPLRN